MFNKPFHLPKLGSLWMLVAAFGFAIMGALVKVGANTFTSAELVFYRSIFGLFSICILIYLKKWPLKSPVLYKHLGRSLAGFFALLLFFYAIAHLPLATAITLNYTSPLFLAAFMPFMLKQEHQQQRAKRALYLSLLIGFIGVAMLLHPIFNKQDSLAGIIGLLSGFGAGIAYVQVKQLGQYNEPDWRTVFYFTLVCSIGAGLWMCFQPFTPLHWQHLPVLLGIGVTATISQLALTRAYRTGKTLLVASLAYTTVVFASILGVLFWQETFTTQELIAMALIVLSGILSTIVSNKS
jgi:drug/metabolite transporter (DMT)-like permease